MQSPHQHSLRQSRTCLQLVQNQVAGHQRRLHSVLTRHISPASFHQACRVCFLQVCRVLCRLVSHLSVLPHQSLPAANHRNNRQASHLKILHYHHLHHCLLQIQACLPILPAPNRPFFQVSIQAQIRRLNLQLIQA